MRAGPTTFRSRTAVMVAAGTVALVVATATLATAEAPARAAGTLAARASAGATATEYWDVTAWLDSGHRVFARFVVTNEGPGVRTAAAIAHVVPPEGEVLEVRWGRREGDWRLARNGRRLAIASAVLDMSGSAIVLDVDTDKRGVVLHLEAMPAGAPVAATPLPGAYALDVVMPSPVSGRLWTRGMAAPITVSGTAALTHTAMEERESTLLRRRAELLARAGDVALYLADLTLPDGARRSVALASRGGRLLERADDVSVAFGARDIAPPDARYPVAARWDARGDGFAADADVSPALLRFDPLAVVPQPFRFLLALRGRPQRVWADAAVDLTAAPRAGNSAMEAHGNGIATVTFAGPVD